MTDEQKGVEIVKHLDAICEIMGVESMTTAANKMMSSLNAQRASIEAATGQKVDDAMFDGMTNGIVSQVGLSIGAMMSEYQKNLMSTLNDPDKVSDLANKTFEEMKNGRQ